MRIRVRLVLYAIAVATAGMLLFGVLLSTLARGGVAEDQDAALGRAGGRPGGRRSRQVGPDLLSGREPLVAAGPAHRRRGVPAGHRRRWARPRGAARCWTGQPSGCRRRVVVEAFETWAGPSATTRPDGGLELRMVAVPWVFGDGGGVVVAAQPIARARRSQVEALDGFLVIAGVVTIVAVGIVSAGWSWDERCDRCGPCPLTTDAIARTGRPVAAAAAGARAGRGGDADPLLQRDARPAGGDRRRSWRRACAGAAADGRGRVPRAADAADHDPDQRGDAARPPGRGRRRASRRPWRTSRTRRSGCRGSLDDLLLLARADAGRSHGGPGGRARGRWTSRRSPRTWRARRAGRIGR